jgi:hypothetical protein
MASSSGSLEKGSFVAAQLPARKVVVTGGGASLAASWSLVHRVCAASVLAGARDRPLGGSRGADREAGRACDGTASRRPPCRASGGRRRTSRLDHPYVIVDRAAGVSSGTRANVTRARCSARDVASRWLVASVTPRRTMFARAERHRSSRQPCRRRHSAYPRSTRLPSGRPRFPLCQQAHPVSRARGAALACAR